MGRQICFINWKCEYPPWKLTSSRQYSATDLCLYNVTSHWSDCHYTHWVRYFGSCEPSSNPESEHNCWVLIQSVAVWHSWWNKHEHSAQQSCYPPRFITALTAWRVTLIQGDTVRFGLRGRQIYFSWTEPLKKHSNVEDCLFSHPKEITKENKSYISH